MKTVGVLVGILVLIVLSFLNGLLGAHVLLSIAVLYKLTFITNFSFVQIFGILVIVGILKYKYNETEKKDEDNSFEKSFLKSIGAIISSSVFYLITWGLAYLALAFL